MWRRTFGALAGLALVAVGACEKPPPATPTPPAPIHATIVVNSISVTGERAAAGGYTYRVVLHLRETGGATATISAVNLTFVNDSGTVVSARYDQPIPATGNMCPANGTADTREFVTTDANAAHAFAQSVQATVTYTDAAATAGTATGSASIPPLPASPPVTYTLTGVITDAATGGGIQGARVEALNGANAGKAVTTDGSGVYTLAGLTAETFRMRASATGYDWGEQNVTVPDVPRADLTLQRSTTSCAYTVSPTGTINVSYLSGQIGVTLTRTSGSCSWQATTDAEWLTPPGATGSGTASLTFSYTTNSAFAGRLGTITFSWTGGSVRLQVSQDREPDNACKATLTVGGRNPLDSVPAAGGSYTADLAPVPGTPAGVCGLWTASASAPITIVGATSGPALPVGISFTVAANPTPMPRTGFITVAVGGSGASLTVNQLAGP